MRWRMICALLPLAASCDGGGDDDTGDDTADDTSDTDDSDTADTDTADTDTADTDTGDSGDTGDTGDTDTGPLPTRFYNQNPACASLSALRPSSGEDGHWAAVRLTPPSYPFDLETIRLTLIHDPTASSSPVQCTSNQAYTVKLYVVSGTAPPNGTGTAPTPDEEWLFTAGAVPGERLLEGDLDPVITLTTGEHVILAIDTHYTSDSVRTCIKTCNTGTPDNTRNYWSNAADPAAWAWSGLTLAGSGIWAEGEGFPQ